MILFTHNHFCSVCANSDFSLRAAASKGHLKVVS